jgi:hypothetical protein
VPVCSVKEKLRLNIFFNYINLKNPAALPTKSKNLGEELKITPEAIKSSKMYRNSVFCV